MAQRMLSGVAVADSWLSLVGALVGAVRALGAPADPTTLAGRVGLAFRTPLRQVDGEVAAPHAEACFDPRALTRRLAHAGWKAAALVSWPDERDFAQRRAEVIKQVRRAIDHGRPALVYGLQLPRWGLVKGYDDQGERWAVSTMLSGQYGEALPLTRWPAAELAAPVALVLLDGAIKFDPHKATLAALSEAIDHVERGEPGDPSGARHGLAALDRWAAAFAAGEPVSRAGNTTLAQTVQAARREAAAFLRGSATIALPQAAPLLAQAAAAYEAEALALSRMLTMFPYPGGGDPASPAARAVATAALRAAIEQERAALGALRSVVA